MRTLPDKPSLDYLRQEAKDLLVALREATPGASLAEAQKALSEQYGFRAWPDLKAEVDKRRSTVQPGDPALATQIASAFGLGRVTGPLQPVAFGLMGRSWVLETEAGRWTAGPIFGYITEESSQTSMRLRDAAADAGVLSPRPVRTPTGQYQATIDGQKWRVDEWMEHGPSQTRPVRSSIATKVGEVLATLHGLAIPAPDGVISWYTHRRPEEDFRQLLDRARAARVDWLADLERALPAILELFGVTSPEASSEPILCHGDITPECVCAGPGDEIVVLHWDFAGGGIPEWELATVLLQFAGFEGEEVNLRAARALAEGYRQRRGSLPELNVSSFASTVTGTLNYMYGQICGALGDLTSDSPEQHARYVTETCEMLRNPLRVHTLEQIVQAATQRGGLGIPNLLRRGG